MEAPTDVQKLIEQVQLLLAQSAAQNERIAALEAENAALKRRWPHRMFASPIWNVDWD
jgi:hypothetical protein